MPNINEAPLMGNKKKNIGKSNHPILVRLIIILVSLIVIALGCLGFISYQATEEMKNTIEVDTIYPNIYINGVNVGNLSKAEARELLSENMERPLLETSIIFVSPNLEESYSLNDFGVHYNMETAIDAAFAYAREGTVKERYQKIQALSEQPCEIELEMLSDDSLLRQTVEALPEKVNVAPVNASISRKGGAFHTTPEQTGLTMDVESTYQQAKTLLDNLQGGRVDVVLQIEEPKFKEADFDNAKSLIGGFSTVYSPGENGRNTNIKVALATINDYVVYPGEIFSTNKAFGPTTHANGYRAAPVIIGGKLQDDFGGGVCQVSSTLYNTLLYAELEIVERQNHSLKVGYTNWGFDATLAGDYIDLKFKNNTEYPVFIEGFIDNGKVTVNIYGHEIHNPSRKLEFTNALLGSIPPPAEVIAEDASLPKGQKVVDSPARTGYKYDVYKFVYEDGKEVEKVHVNTSTYRATRAEIRVGTGPGTPTNATGEEPPADTSGTVPPQADNVDVPVTNPADNNEPVTPPTDISVPPAQIPIIDVPSNAEVPSSVIEEALRNSDANELLMPTE